MYIRGRPPCYFKNSQAHALGFGHSKPGSFNLLGTLSLTTQLPSFLFLFSFKYINFLLLITNLPHAQPLLELSKAAQKHHHPATSLQLLQEPTAKANYNSGWMLQRDQRDSPEEERKNYQGIKSKERIKN